MPEISSASVPRKECELEVFGLIINASFSLGSMTGVEYDALNEAFRSGEVDLSVAIDHLIAMDFKWDMTENGNPIPITKEALMSARNQVVVIQTFWEVLNSFAPKESTPSTSAPGSKPKGSGARSRGNRKGASSH